MIFHAVQVVIHELNLHFQNILTDNVFGAGEDQVELGSIALFENNGGVVEEGLKDKIIATVVNIREEKTLKNTQHYRVDQVRLRTDYFNPSVFLNVYLLLSPTTANYGKALSELSRIIRFFQYKSVFTHENSAPVPGGVPVYDQMSEFKIMMDLCSPSFEELNHLWGTLGGRQFPSALYQMRLLELRHTDLLQGSGSVITDVQLGYESLEKFKPETL